MAGDEDGDGVIALLDSRREVFLNFKERYPDYSLG
jgi:hypothetical protein